LQQNLNLNGSNWQFGSVPAQPWPHTHTPTPDDRSSVSEWLPATVPGDVRADLLALNRIPNPERAANLPASQWVDDQDWWYRRPLPELEWTPGRRAFLIFAGIDYRAAVFLDDHCLGRHEGMFSQQVYEVTDWLAERPDGAHELAIRLWGNASLPKPQLDWLDQLWRPIANFLGGGEQYPERMATAKCQMGFGWDFAPRLPSLGIWDDVTLRLTGPVALAGLRHEIALTGLDATTGRAESAQIRLTFTTDWRATGPVSPSRVQTTPDSQAGGDGERPCYLRVTVAGENFSGDAPVEAGFPLTLTPGHQEHRVSVTIPRPRLWQPWDRGEPALYRLTVTLYQDRMIREIHHEEHEGHESLGTSRITRLPVTPAPGTLDGRVGRLRVISDVASIPLGLRTVEWRPTTGADPARQGCWQLRVNGRPTFVRGVNWVPADVFPGRLRPDDYADLLRRIRDLNANLVRVWGGGLREKAAFYDQCDRLGLLVWQEFPLACIVLGRYPRDPSLITLLTAESRAIVEQLRSHPSVIVWSGGNELSTRHNRHILTPLLAAVREADPTRLTLPASPSPGDHHNWRVWHRLAPVRDYRCDTSPLISEFGLQAPPDPASLAQFIPQEQLWPPGPAWTAHKTQWPKLWRYARLFLPTGPSAMQDRGNQPPHRQADQRSSQSTSRSMRDPTLQQFVTASQQAQAHGLQVMIEQARRRKGGSGGVVLWQYNEPWPAISWSILDYYRRPKLAYAVVQAAYAPLLASLEYDLVSYPPGSRFVGRVWLLNDLALALDNLSVEVLLGDERIFAWTGTALPDSVTDLGEVRATVPAGVTRARTVVRRNHSAVSDNEYDLTYADPTSTSLLNRCRDWAIDRLMQ